MVCVCLPHSVPVISANCQLMSGPASMWRHVHVHLHVIMFSTEVQYMYRNARLIHAYTYASCGMKLHVHVQCLIRPNRHCNATT